MIKRFAYKIPVKNLFADDEHLNKKKNIILKRFTASNPET